MNEKQDRFWVCCWLAAIYFALLLGQSGRPEMIEVNGVRCIQSGSKAIDCDWSTRAEAE